MSTARQSRRRASARARVVLPAAMKPTRYTLSSFTPVDTPRRLPVWLVGGQPLQRFEKSGVRDDDRIGSVDGRRTFGRERGDSKGHGHAVIASCVRDAAGRAPGRGDAEPVRPLVGRQAERPHAIDQRRDSIAFLDAQLGGAADRDLAAVRGERRDGRQLVDEPGHLLGRDCHRAHLRRVPR